MLKRKDNTMKISQAVAVSLFEQIGYKSAKNWSVERLTEKLRKVLDSGAKFDVADKQLVALLGKLSNANTVVVEGDGGLAVAEKVPDSPAVSRVKEEGEKSVKSLRPTSKGLAGLDSIVPCRVAKKSGHRVLTSHFRDDAVSRAMNDCNSAAEIGELALKFGLREAEVIDIAKSCSNFGQFRMCLANRFRGAARRMERAKKSGKTLTLEQAAHPKEHKGQNAVA